MKLKTTLSAALLVFVATAILAVVLKELRPRLAPGDESISVNAANGNGKIRTVVYYFHGNARCADCENMERFAREAVEEGFPDDLRGGRLEFRVVNYDEAAGEHFKTDFELIAPTVVFAETRGGSPLRYRNLQEIWDFRSDRAGFIDLVRSGLRSFLTQGERG